MLGLRARPDDFRQLLQVLNSELRLVTPTDPEGREEEEEGSEKEETRTQCRHDSDPSPFAPHTSSFSHRYFQLTHDYLVPSLRDWLTRKQKETRRGRAELKLAGTRRTLECQTREPTLAFAVGVWQYPLADASQQLDRTTAHDDAPRPVACTPHDGARACLRCCCWYWQYSRTISRFDHRNLSERLQTAVAAVGNSRGPVVPLAIEDLEEFPADMVLEELNQEYANPNNSRQPETRVRLSHWPSTGRSNARTSWQRLPPRRVKKRIISSRRWARNARRRSTDLRKAAVDATSKLDWKLKTRLATVALYLDDKLDCGGHAARGARLANGSDVGSRRNARCSSSISPTWSGSVEKLVDVLQKDDNASLRSGFSLALGSVENAQCRSEEDLGAGARRLVSESADKGVHGATKWALQSWTLTLPNLDTETPPPTDCQWRVTKKGLTMVRIPLEKSKCRKMMKPMPNPRPSASPTSSGSAIAK